MKNLIRKIRRKLSWLGYRRNYYLSKLFPKTVPPNPLPHLPDGFRITKVADTGLRVIDNICTQEEADYLINQASQNMVNSQVIVDGKAVLEKGRTSSNSVVFHRFKQDPKVLPLIGRGAMLAGVPADHAEQIYVTCYSPGEFYHGHYDFANDFITSHRLCTMLIYLNDVDADCGGATYFRDLNVAVQPRMGRAVCWTNINPDGSQHRETLHAALPTEGETTEKWVVQIWYRPYRMHKLHQKLEALQASEGQPLQKGDPVPDGAWTIS